MLASVLIPSFGRPAHLARCLQALALQTRVSVIAELHEYRVPNKIL